MFMPDIKRGSPEQVFISVRNADSVSIPVGYAVFYNMTMGGDNDGYYYCHGYFQRSNGFSGYYCH